MLKGGVGNQACVPVVFTVDFYGRKSRRKCGTCHDVLGGYGNLRAVEIGEGSCAHIYCTHTQTYIFDVVDSLKINKLKQSLFELACVVIAEGTRHKRQLKRPLRPKEARLTERKCHKSAHAALPLVERPYVEIQPLRRRLGNAFPKFAKVCNAIFFRVVKSLPTATPLSRPIPTPWALGDVRSGVSFGSWIQV